MASFSATLKIKVIKADGLICADFATWSDPYCLLKTMDGTEAQVRSDTVWDMKNAEWNQNLELQLDGCTTVVAEFWDDDKDSGADAMGEIVIPLDKFGDGAVHEDWYDLEPPSDEGKRWAGHILRDAAAKAGMVGHADHHYGRALLQFQIEGAGGAPVAAAVIIPEEPDDPDMPEEPEEVYSDSGDEPPQDVPDDLVEDLTTGDVVTLVHLATGWECPMKFVVARPPNKREHALFWEYESFMQNNCATIRVNRGRKYPVVVTECSHKAAVSQTARWYVTAGDADGHFYIKNYFFREHDWHLGSNGEHFISNAPRDVGLWEVTTIEELGVDRFNEFRAVHGVWGGGNES